MKSSKEYYSEIYYSGVDRYFECKVRAQEYYIKVQNGIVINSVISAMTAKRARSKVRQLLKSGCQKQIMFASLLFNCMIRKA